MRTLTLIMLVAWLGLITPATAQVDIPMPNSLKSGQQQTKETQWKERSKKKKEQLKNNLGERKTAKRKKGQAGLVFLKPSPLPTPAVKGPRGRAGGGRG